MFIHLSQQQHYPPYIYETFMRYMAYNTHILFIIPEHVKVEWKRVIEEKEQSFVEIQKKPLREALSLTKHLNNDEQKKVYRESLEQALRIKDRIHKYVFKKRIRLINDILFNEDPYLTGSKVMVGRTPEIDKLLIDLSLNHAAPFFGSDKGKGKINEMADALIFFSACNYAERNPELCESYFFITDETNFSKGPNLHENIKEHAEVANLNFYCSFKTFVDTELKELAKRCENAEDQPLFLSDSYFKTCEKCNGEVHINVDGNYKHSPLGEDFWYYMCDCGHEWHEFEDRWYR